MHLVHIVIELIEVCIVITRAYLNRDIPCALICMYVPLSVTLAPKASGHLFYVILISYSQKIQPLYTSSYFIQNRKSEKYTTTKSNLLVFDYNCRIAFFASTFFQGERLNLYSAFILLKVKLPSPQLG